jgi:hypothetical protein
MTNNSNLKNMKDYVNLMITQCQEIRSILDEMEYENQHQYYESNMMLDQNENDKNTPLIFVDNDDDVRIIFK